MRSFSAVAHVLLLAGVFAAPLGCGGKSHGSGPDVSGGGGAAGQGGAPAVECPAGIPSAAELAATPREDISLELLALKLSAGIVAEQAIYDRVVRDVAAIRMLAPELADVSYFAPNDGRSLDLSVDSPTYEAMQAGSYDAWSCLNEAYGAGAPSFIDFGGFTVSFMLRGIYNLSLVGTQYATLPGVKSAGPGTGGGGGPTICLSRDGATWHYVFDQASGDCPLGCIDHKYSHFTTSSAGDIANLGTPSPTEQAQYASAEACR